MNNDNFFMQRCLDLAIKGIGKTYPNPLVGCVIVLDNKIISEGWHKSYGGIHAEVDAINKIKD
ncbi:MAG: riboflavin biosynthesis protein RibD, partial [Pelagibacterales bacterium]|nr:riboflavin biosynthesis protein RibD [Pelagibacterales bacterium]